MLDGVFAMFRLRMGTGTKCLTGISNNCSVDFKRAYRLRRKRIHLCYVFLQNL